MPKSPEEIADLIRKLQKTYAGTSATLYLFSHSRIFDFLDSTGVDRGSSIILRKKDGSNYDGLDIYESINEIRSSNINMTWLLKNIHITRIIRIGDQLDQNDYFDKAPVLEFFRHLRNAVSHGNEFTFYNDEPKRNAEFGSFKLDDRLNGTTALFEYIGPGDVMELFDEVENHLRSIS